jgi:hypothetical protein
MSNRKFLLFFSLILLLAYALESLIFAWDFDEGVSIQHTSNWLNQWLLQGEGWQKGEWHRLFSWPWIHDLNRIHFGINLALLLLLTWFIPRIPLKKLIWGMVASWAISTLFFLLFAPKSHYLLGSSHWVFFLWGLAIGNENLRIRSIFAPLGVGLVLVSFFTSDGLSGIIHALSFVLGLVFILKSQPKTIPTVRKEQPIQPARLQLIQQKIQQSGFESLLMEEQQLWKEAHGKLD